MRKLVIGILAHVDAGKTTLAESILYQTGSIRKLGRVDHKNAFLDTYEIERDRGITIFSKQAVFTIKDLQITLLDTPGHVDFSAEMERTLQVLDYAVLVISASAGIQGHTQTLWRLLARYRIPTFLFINKMDLPGCDRSKLMEDMKKRLDDGCMEFDVEQDRQEWQESIAMCDETLLEKFIDSGSLGTEDAAELIAKRIVFPCYFGSALKLDGVDTFLNGLERYTICMHYPEEFGAKIYKIARDEQGKRLTYMKITGGSLKIKMLLTNRKENDTVKSEFERTLPDHWDRQAENETIKSDSRKNQLRYGRMHEKADVWEEKVDQIRIYSGARYETTDEVTAGTLCAISGLSMTYPGESLGIAQVSELPILEPVLNFQVLLPPDCDAHVMLLYLRQLEEEDPQLHIVWMEQLKEIHVQLMGEVQVEVLKNLIMERFHVNVEFGTGNIVYKETIARTVEGVGHFEPLRHYAEVHLLLEPDEPGSGLTFFADCSEDDLERSWQRLVLTHLEEKQHVGVLTASPITDMKLTLIAGRAHLKHTEGGDFRQATYRALRQGLKKANSVLLEPFYNYILEVPSETVGRAMSDIGRMCGNFRPPEMDGDMSVLTGSAPVATMRGYQMEVTSYTRGRGRLFCTLRGYEPCHNAEEVIQAIGYDSERDPENPTSSVFCAHGTGFLVEWDRVEEYMHVDSGYKPVRMYVNESDNIGKEPANRELKQLIAESAKSMTSQRGYEIQELEEIPTSDRNVTGQKKISRDNTQNGSWQEDKELEAIFVRTFGPMKQKTSYSSGGLGYEKNTAVKDNRDKPKELTKEKKPALEYLLVDGYNIIFSWEELKELAKDNLDAARNKLMDILCNYQGFKKCILILVFDAYKVKGGTGEISDYHNIHVVYTKEAETADEYIEKVTHEIAREHRVTVATSDALEQVIIMGQGAIRLSANDLKEEITRIRDQIRRDYLDKQLPGRIYLGEQLSESWIELLQDEDKEDKG